MLKKTLLSQEKKGEIVAHHFITGSQSTISLNDIDTQGGFLFIKKWSDKQAEISIYHNHPNRYAAIPSWQDLTIFAFDLDTNKLDSDLAAQIIFNSADYYFDDNNISKTFRITEIGVVTSSDFFSIRLDDNAIYDAIRRSCSEKEQLNRLFEKHISLLSQYKTK